MPNHADPRSQSLYTARSAPATTLIRNLILERRATVRNQPLEFEIRIGLPAIDRDHVALVKQLDHLNSHNEAHPGGDTFSEVLSQLGHQINAHFDSEEEILRSCGMPPELVLEHIQAHTEIIEQYTLLNLDLMAGKTCSREDALGLVRHWIVDHVLNHDVKISEYLPENGAGATLTS